MVFCYDRPSNLTYQVIAEETASLVDWIKNSLPVMSFYPRRGLSDSFINAQWNTPDEAVDMLPMQATWD